MSIAHLVYECVNDQEVCGSNFSLPTLLRKKILYSVKNTKKKMSYWRWRKKWREQRVLWELFLNLVLWSSFVVTYFYLVYDISAHKVIRVIGHLLPIGFTNNHEHHVYEESDTSLKAWIDTRCILVVLLSIKENLTLGMHLVTLCFRSHSNDEGGSFI